MNERARQKYTAWSLRNLRKLAGDIQELIAELESRPPRDIDIASDHTGDPALVERVVRTEGDPQSGNWYQIERIFCSAERCPSCPHGDFKYRYQRSKTGKITKYSCTMAFAHETIEALRAGVREPIAAYVVETARDVDKAT